MFWIHLKPVVIKWKGPNEWYSTEMSVEGNRGHLTKVKCLLSTELFSPACVRTSMCWRWQPSTRCWRGWNRPMSSWRWSSKVSITTWRRSVSIFRGSSSCLTKSCWKSSLRPRTLLSKFKHVGDSHNDIYHYNQNGCVKLDHPNSSGHDEQLLPSKIHYLPSVAYIVKWWINYKAKPVSVSTRMGTR